MASKTMQKTSNDLFTPADFMQATILLDKSGSMREMGSAPRLALGKVVEDLKAKVGMTFAIKTFNRELETVTGFGEAPPQVFPYDASGSTHLYRAVRDVIRQSKEEAALTPEIKTHHLVVVITDGLDEDHDADIHLPEAQAEIDSISAGGAATFILLDFSHGGYAGRSLGLKGIKIEHDPDAFRDAMNQVSKAIAQVAENVIKQLPPTTGLCLPPAR